MNVKPHGIDTLVWLPSPSKGFWVKSYNNVRYDQTGHTGCFPWKCIWKPCRSPIMCFMVRNVFSSFLHLACCFR
jgi:hypothetical protein